MNHVTVTRFQFHVRAEEDARTAFANALRGAAKAVEECELIGKYLVVPVLLGDGSFLRADSYEVNLEGGARFRRVKLPNGMYVNEADGEEQPT